MYEATGPQKTMSTPHNDEVPGDSRTPELTRRALLHAATAVSAALFFPRDLMGSGFGAPDTITPPDKRFPHFQSTPVSYRNVQLQDRFWAPRQVTVHAASVPWATRHFDGAGGVDAYRAHPKDYVAEIEKGDLEAIKFVESMASVIGLQRDAAIEGLMKAWAREMIAAQQPDGYWPFGWPLASDPAHRWRAVWWSHEDYALGHYLESGIAFRESTGDAAMYESAVRAVDNMASTFLGNHRAYAPGHEEIEQALMRLYGETGDPKYLALCGWLIGQRGHHEGRRNYGKYSQDHLPVEQQRTIEGHAVRAAFLYNGVTEYVGATGHPGYREAVLAVWDDLVNHKMYLHGAGGTVDTVNEGYSSKVDSIPPADCYGESCSVFGNFQWAHNLFRLTGDAAYIDVAERMLYNAFYASLALSGDRYFYENPAQQDRPTERFAWHPVPCCPPNIVKLFAKVGGFFYSTDTRGIFVKHYGASTAHIPFGRAVTIVQRGEYPWDGKITLEVTPQSPTNMALRLRIPAWAKGHTVSVNGTAIETDPERGWVTIQREWRGGDTVELNLKMQIERVTMPERFKDYKDLAALQRGPIVYCLEEQDLPREMRHSFDAYLPEEFQPTAEHRPELLGGVTVLRGSLQLQNWTEDTEKPVPVTFIPYGVWDNRSPGAMRIWVPAKKTSLEDSVPADPPGSPPASNT
jgi:DUF1680 family protein